MEKGLIVNHITNEYGVEVEGEIYTCSARGKFKKEDIKPVVGDRVKIEILDEEKKQAVINEIEARSNYIKRPKVANLTQMVYVVSLNLPSPDLFLLNKQLTFAKFMNIKPIICLNKTDLDSDNLCKEIEEQYKKIGYIVLKTNAKTKEGVEKLKEYLKGNITAFSGNSGVGKSTLINAIFEEMITEEGEISKKNKKGKNTTTSVCLYKLGKDSYIADTPGFSTFEIDEIESNELGNYFIDFIEPIKKCEFVGCNHILEDNCGVKDAVKEGKISEQRYDSYVKIYNILKDKEEHKW